MLSVRQVIFLVLAWQQMCYVTGSGVLFVGLMGYSNDELIDCCKNASLCTSEPYCDLVFEIEIMGLNGSDDSVVVSPSDRPLSPSEAVSFPEGEGIVNPLSFSFNKWPGGVNVTVSVYNGSKSANILVEQFDLMFNHEISTVYYIQKTLVHINDDEDGGNSNFTNTSISLVFRYHCVSELATTCPNDCVDPDPNEPCPAVPTAGTTDTPVTTPVTFTGFMISTTTCVYNDTTEKISGLKCKEIKTPTMPQKTPTLPTNASHPFFDSGPSLSTTSTSSLTTSTLSSATSTPSLKMSTTETSTQPTTAPKTTPTSTTPFVIYKEKEAILENWPAIVGGVLGGLIVLSLVGYFLYRKRQKKMRKRQEIYNVNPKILRNFEEYEENGTSGRADVPLETEQY